MRNTKENVHKNSWLTYNDLQMTLLDGTKYLTKILEQSANNQNLALRSVQFNATGLRLLVVSLLKHPLVSAKSKTGSKP